MVEFFWSFGGMDQNIQHIGLLFSSIEPLWRFGVTFHNLKSKITCRMNKLEKIPSCIFFYTRTASEIWSDILENKVERNM